MSEISDKTLRVIAERGIHPQSAWNARIRNATYWTGTFLLAVLLAIAFIFHALFEIDWSAYTRANFSWIDILISGVPFLSLFLLGAFLFASIDLWRRTHRGYRWSTVSILVLLVCSSGSAGYLVENSALDEPVEAFLLRSFPHSEQFENGLRPSAERQWAQPEKGLLGGTVMNSDTRRILLLDSRNTLWTVDYSSTVIAADVTLQPDEAIKIIGQQTGVRTFQANEIHDWKHPHEPKRLEKDNRDDDTSPAERDGQETSTDHGNEERVEKHNQE
jgi:hypothetical protein